MPRWTEESRIRQRVKIRGWKPWEHSTGPKSLSGKARSSQNARIPELEKHERELLELAQAIGGGEVYQTENSVVYEYKLPFPRVTTRKRKV